ncbi:hypothetical protein SBRCBS47491_004517 [Sporothrix bragantina]|uniref:Ig-like domain-containing protein n=1 Tax=Sporothrix bragantina TaxID=671064 RepID=A0ABP0BP25_9PEZI
MKFTTINRLLALGLAIATPVTASVCHPSKAASPSVSTSATSSLSSSSSAAFAAPTCGIQLVTNGDFRLGGGGWTNEGSVTPLISTGCYGKQNCYQASSMSSTVASFSQDVPTVIGGVYTFSLYYLISSVDLTGTDSMTCSLLGTVNSLPVATDYNLVASSTVANSIEGDWNWFETTYKAVAAVTTVQCVVSSSNSMTVLFDNISLEC